MLLEIPKEQISLYFPDWVLYRFLFYLPLFQACTEAD